MPTVIDSLIVSLGLDAKNFDQGQKKAVESLHKMENESNRTAKKMEASGKQAAEFFSKVRNQAVGFIAILAGANGVKSFTTSINAADAATGYLAKNLGMSSSSLSAWQGAAERAGGTSAGMAGSIKSLVGEFQNFALTGQSSVIPYFRSVGVAVSDANGKLRPMGDILLDLADKFKGMDPARAQALGRGMGLDEGTINLLQRGRGAVEGLLKEQEKIGKASEADTEAAQRLQSSWRSLSQSTEDLGRKMLTDATPGIVKALDALHGLTDWGHNNLGKMEAGFAALTATLAALKGMSFARLIGSITGITPAVSSVGRALGTVLRYAAKLGIITTAASIALDPSETNSGEADILAKSDAEKRKSMGFKDGEAPSTPGGGGDKASSNKAVRDPEGKKKAMAFFQSKGWTKEQAAGIVANLDAESGMDHQAVGDGGKAYGIGQWHPDRQAAFKKKFFKDITQSTQQEQMEFVDYELRTSEKKAGDALKKSRTAREAGEIVSRQYERPAAKDEAARNRAAAAEGISMLNPGPKPDGSLSTGAGARVASASANTSSNTSTSTTEVHVGTVTVQTQATDAEGIAKGIGPAIEKYSFANQANQGLD